MTRKVGVLVGREWSFPPRFLEAVQQRGQGVVAEYVKLGGTRMDEPVPYAVLVDRISHEVPYYRTYLKHAFLHGVTVVNNPLMWTADDKFFEASLAAKLGVAHPRTLVLPNRDYVPGIVHNESLRNLIYPLDWQGIIDYVGLPCILKDAHGGGWRGVYKCHSLDELIHHYNSSGLLTMIVQEFIRWEQYVRCVCIGRRDVLPICYDPNQRRYLIAEPEEFLGRDLAQRIIEDSLKLVNALGYDMNSVEWAVRGGVPYAIDFMNPAPDFDINSLTPGYFDWVVEHMADLVIRLANAPQPANRELRVTSWF
jgi:glutathione synthase/RimK-type ligase-like ATP-grasp enzyme